MNFNNSKTIPIIIISLLCGTLYIIKTSFFIPSLPETFIGLNGLYKIKTYLLKQIISEITFSILTSSTFILLFNHFYLKEIKSKIKYTLLIPLLIIVTITSLEKSNQLDLQCNLVGIPDIKIYKSIVLLENVTYDINKQEYESVECIKLSASNDKYSFSTGRSKFSQSNYVIKSNNSTLVAQISQQDAQKLSSDFSKNAKYNYEKYQNSGFIKEINICDTNNN